MISQILNLKRLVKLLICLKLEKKIKELLKIQILVQTPKKMDSNKEKYACQNTNDENENASLQKQPNKKEKSESSQHLSINETTQSKTKKGIVRIDLN